MQQIRGKRAVITGAASGIGRAIAIELAQAGCHLCLLDINASGLARTVQEAEQLGVEAFGLMCDLANEDDLDRTLDRMLAWWPQIDILVNNAGIVYRGRTAEMARDDWQRILAVNLHGPMQICQRLLPVLLDRPESHVLNVCSLLGLCGVSRFAAYNTSKFALVGYTEALRAEYLGSQLGVSAVCPGFVRTPFIESLPGAGGIPHEQTTPWWLGTTPEVVARKSVKAIRRNRRLVVITPLAHLLWRLKRFTPALLELPRRFKKRRIAPPASDCDLIDATEPRKVA